MVAPKWLLAERSVKLLDPTSSRVSDTFYGLIQRTMAQSNKIQKSPLSYGPGFTSGPLLEAYNVDSYPSTKRSLYFVDHSSTRNSVDPSSPSASINFDEKLLAIEAISMRLAYYGSPFRSFQISGTTPGALLYHLPQQMSTRRELRAFQYRTFTDPTQKHSVETLTRLLSSYPTMMLRRETFPPFIHPQCTPEDEVDPPLLQPLVKCMEIAHAFK